MATIDGPKYIGPLTVDLSDVKDDLVDLPPGAMKGIRAEQEGIDSVVQELSVAMPAYGDAAQIPPAVYQNFLKRTALLALLRTHEMELEKMLEVCRESRVKTANDREDDISIIAKCAQDAARRAKDPGITAPFQETIKYNTQIADRGVHTRKKKAEAAKNAAAVGGGHEPRKQGG